MIVEEGRKRGLGAEPPRNLFYIIYFTLVIIVSNAFFNVTIVPEER